MVESDRVTQSRQQVQSFVRKSAAILEMIATGQSAPKIYDAIALMYEARNPGMRCSLLELKGDKLMHGGAPSLPKEYCDAVNGLKFGPCVGSCGTSTYTGKRVLVENIETDPKWSELKQVALPHGMRCCWSEPIKDSSGKVLGAFGMYYNHPALPNEDELVDLKSATRLAGIIMERDQREIDLRQNEKKYRTLFENMAQGVFYQQSDGTFTDYNQNALKLLGLTKDQFLARTAVDPKWKVIHEDGSDYPGNEYPSMVALKTGKPVLNKIAGVFSALKKEYVWLNINAIPQFKGGESKPYQVFVTLDDISELKKTAKKLRQAHKMESIGTLSGGIAHDFNNLLYMIIGNTELALEEIPKWNLSYKNLEEIKSASLKASDIVKQLLNFSRKVDQELKPISAIPIFEDALKFLRSTIPSTIEIKKQLPDDDIAILGDPTQINQLMMNICTNAYQEMEESGGTLEIKVEYIILSEREALNYSDIEKGGYLKITISDTGPGITAKNIDKIFDPYFTTKEVGKGSGMGLAVVHGIVKNHNGNIKIDSQPGDGAVFTILIPAIHGSPERIGEEMTDRFHGTESILFVDDEQLIVNMAGKIISRLGYKVETKLNPEEALHLFRSKPERIDLVITDMTMPQMTGVKLVEKLKGIRPDIPVIICTGHSALLDEEKAKELGIDEFIMKPVSMVKMAKTIREVLDQ